MLQERILEAICGDQELRVKCFKDAYPVRDILRALQGQPALQEKIITTIFEDEVLGDKYKDKQSELQGFVVLLNNKESEARLLAKNGQFSQKQNNV